MDERFWESVVSSLTKGVMVTDPHQPDNPIIYVNPAFEQLSGYTAAEVLGRNSRFLHGGDQNQPGLDDIRAAFGKERSAHVTLRNYRKDGSPYWIELINSPIHNADGQLLYYLGVLTDISQNKHAELALLESERFIQHVANTMPGILYIFDLVENQMIYVNREIGFILGYAPDAIQRMGSSLFETLMHPDDARTLPELLGRFRKVRDGELVETEYRLRHANGEWRWLSSLDAVFTREADGAPRQIVGIAQDVTMRKQAEQEVLRLNTELEQRVRERTEELSATVRQLKREIVEREMAEAALRQSKYDLEKRVTERTMKLTEVNRRLRHLTQQVVKAQEEERKRLSRELHDEAGQALTTLTLSLDLIAEDLPEEAAVFRERLDESAVLAKSIMEQMRRISHNLRPPALDKLGLSAALDNICKDFAKRTRITVNYNSPTEAITMPDTVGICLYRFLQEALTNVAKHAGAGAVRVNLEWLSGPGWVSLSVEDDGKGFDWEGLAAGALPGGIGLKGTQEQFESLGGGLLIESRPGEGTRLVGYLPSTAD